MKQIYNDISKNCLGYKTNTKRKKWLVPSKSWETIKKRCNIKRKELNLYSERLKNKYKQEYRTVNKEVKKLARRDKRAYINNVAIQAEDVVWKNEQGHLYKLTKLVCGKYRINMNLPIKDKYGNILTAASEQDTR